MTALRHGELVAGAGTVMGQLVHEYSRPHEDWWEVDEALPVIGADTVVGYRATVVGGVGVGAAQLRDGGRGGDTGRAAAACDDRDQPTGPGVAVAGAAAARPARPLGWWRLRCRSVWRDCAGWHCHRHRRCRCGECSWCPRCRDGC